MIVWFFVLEFQIDFNHETAISQKYMRHQNHWYLFQVYKERIKEFANFFYNCRLRTISECTHQGTKAGQSAIEKFKKQPPKIRGNFWFVRNE